MLEGIRQILFGEIPRAISQTNLRRNQGRNAGWIHKESPDETPMELPGKSQKKSLLESREKSVGVPKRIPGDILLESQEECLMKWKKKYPYRNQSWINEKIQGGNLDRHPEKSLRSSSREINTNQQRNSWKKSRKKYRGNHWRNLGKNVRRNLWYNSGEVTDGNPRDISMNSREKSKKKSLNNSYGVPKRISGESL